MLSTLIQKLIRPLVYSNTWIALCAGLCTWQTYLIHALKVDFRTVSLFFFATWARYNIICYTMPAEVAGEKFNYMKQKSTPLKIIFLLSGCASFALILSFSYTDWLFLLHLVLLALWYLFPISIGKLQIRPLRRFPFLKIFLIAYVWASGTYAFPLLHHSWTPEIWMGFFERLLFMFAITVPFDIKDLADDKRLLLQTIPTQIGVKNAKLLSTASLLAGGLFSYLAYTQIYAIGMLAGYLCTILLIQPVKSTSHELHFLGTIDGTMVFQFVLVNIGMLL